jgi:hypothetical protein
LPANSFSPGQLLNQPPGERSLWFVQVFRERPFRDDRGGKKPIVRSLDK